MSDYTSQRQQTTDFITANQLEEVLIVKGSKVRDMRPEANRAESDIGALISGAWIDLNISKTEPVVAEALNFFMPPTANFGYPSKPVSHYLYHLDANFNPTRKTLNKAESFKTRGIELRAGGKKDNLYVALPSCQSSTDELIVWNSTKIVPTPQREVFQSLYVALCAVALIRMTKIETDFEVKLGGLFYRINETGTRRMGVLMEKQTQSVDEFLLLREHGEKIIEFLNTKDPNLDVQKFKEAFTEQTRLRFDSLREGEIWGFLSDIKSMKFEEILNRFALMLYGSSSFIVDTQMIRNRGTYFLRKENLGAVMQIPAKEALELYEDIATSDKANRITARTFDPTTETKIIRSGNETLLNEWGGMAVVSEETTPEEMKPLIEYVETILADGDKELARWIFSWLADIFQDPSHKPGTALLAVGLQGTGKSFLAERIISPIIGERHSTANTMISQLFDSFNSHLDNKLFVGVDETSKNRTDTAKLKNIITCAEFTFNEKHLPQAIKPFHARFYFTSNDTERALGIDAGSDERRFTVIKVSDEFLAVKHDKYKDYWRELADWCRGNLGKIRYFLEHYEYDKNFIATPYDTTWKRRQQESSLDPVVLWWRERLEEGYPLGFQTLWWQALNELEYREYKKSMRGFEQNYICQKWPDFIHRPSLETDFLHWREANRGFGAPRALKSRIHDLVVFPDANRKPFDASWELISGKPQSRGRKKSRGLHRIGSLEECIQRMREKGYWNE